MPHASDKARHPATKLTFSILRKNRGSKDEVLRFRVDPRQKQYWLKAMEKLGVEDFSSYARQAIDRAISQDLRSSNPQWQEFIKAIQPMAAKHLGHEVSDNARDRLENQREIDQTVERHFSRKKP
jgi:hypothetical protein